MFNDPLECSLFHNFIFLLNVFLWLIAMTSFQVCNDFQVDTAPWTLLCNVHWLVMIDVWRKLKDISQQIHDSLRKQKISDCFLVGIEFRNRSFVLKAINVSQILSNKSTQQNWNHCNYFEEFIAPKENISLSLKDNCFNTDAVAFQKLISCIRAQSFRKNNY